MSRSKGTRNDTTILSRRELAVVTLHVAGKSGMEIGAELNISRKTVCTHKARAAAQLGFGAYMPTDVALAVRATEYLKSLTGSPATPLAGDCSPESSSEAPAVSSEVA
jgi:DNA-binding NarL/FixJ family response regulator